ncbi:MAG: DUF2207 domain-containing protein [Acidimicrobiia bacterium]|nr:DUF2207 domain-containing protein [Acidimicrobiia bacterium]
MDEAIAGNPLSWWLVMWGLLAGVAVILYVGRLLRARGGGRQSRRSRPRFVEGVPVEYSPPEGLGPAELGLIVDGSIDERDMVATVIDLVQRGFISVDSTAGRGSDPVIRWEGQNPAGLRPYEATLVGGLFAASPAESHPTVRMSTLLHRMPVVLEGVIRELRRTAIESGWFLSMPRSYFDAFWARLMGQRQSPQQSPQLESNMNGCGCLVVGAVGVFLFGPMLLSLIALASAVRPELIVILGLLLLALVTLAGMRRKRPSKPRHVPGPPPRYTPWGEELRHRTYGFRNLLLGDQGDRMRFADNQGLEHEYLPYAVAFGVVGDRELLPAWAMTQAFETWLQVNSPLIFL